VDNKRFCVLSAPDGYCTSPILQFQDLSLFTQNKLELRKVYDTSCDFTCLCCSGIKLDIVNYPLFVAVVGVCGRCSINRLAFGRRLPDGDTAPELKIFRVTLASR
jgi:hypothetical protein